MKGKKLVYLLALVAFVFSSVPLLSVAKSVKKRHNSVAVLVEPTGVDKVAPKTQSDPSKGVLVKPVLLKKGTPKTKSGRSKTQ
ncbi:hypothetical protein DGMP_21990 [Desulfomarina profundi]|uniref:Uncharacterized protein n=1 Tax=Desulfomarina profundi TaxID=2772557 RepID=A0A8D5JRY0_9BACT|nr:hypothetical protein [Desulfomarina profundi]BCL61506.1 hypothetical protein DGMP_21990 [Desulfomarina profundi]